MPSPGSTPLKGARSPFTLLSDRAFGADQGEAFRDADKFAAASDAPGTEAVVE